MGNEAAALVVGLLTLILLSLCAVNFRSVEAQFDGIYINADGSVTGTNSIQRNGNMYTLMDNVSGGIQVQKSYIVIDGAGYAIEGNGKNVGIDLGNGVGQDPSRSPICNVTVKNLKIINCYYAIGNENTYNNTFIGNYIDHCDTGFWITGSANNTLFHNTIKNCTTGISINYGSGGNVIVENNIMSSFSVWLSPAPVVDRNYWSDYTTRYPNAKEIDDSGIWDTPYDREAFADNNPLIEPIAISSDGNSQVPKETDKPPSNAQPSSATFFAVAAAALVAVIGIGLFLYFNKRDASRKP
ncbi:MAG: right-handed parallel beta-helix repeat-containing protein [Candidatus Bathyarchaeota archaeon]|nr:right-handed parallel beta-helix repeat-containing protein [Candidatus Bathyarchaeota archaeon]